VSLARRLWFGSGRVTLPNPPYTVSGPYDPTFEPAATVLTQLHCHTTQSDGAKSPATVVADYLGAGYDALAITDHDKITTQPAGITTAIPGDEHSPTTQHIIGLNSSYLRGSATDAQEIIDGIVAGGGMAHIAHPKWLRDVTFAELASLTDYRTVEIHNSHCIQGSGQNPVTYPGFAVDRWDQVLASGRRDIWATSVDDLHLEDTFRTFDVGRVQVFTEANMLSDVMASLVSGDFVADVSNHGVTPGYPVRDDESLSVSCTGATRIEAWGAAGLLSSSLGTSHTHPFVGDPYVRLVAVGDYTEGFGSSLPRHWIVQDGTWATGSGVLAHTGDGNARHVILRRHRDGDFEAQVDIRLADDRTNEGALLIFNVLNSSYRYGLRIGVSSDAAVNNKLALQKTSGGSTSLVGATAYTAAVTEWHTVKMAYTAATGTVNAKVWDRDDAEPGSWMLTASDTAWRNGAFGFRANYGAQYDNLYINGFRTYYQPVSVD
jgi:hypothetical protein